MVVCKYFQQGYCRYGQNCRFEHVYGSKYSYHAPQNNPAPQAVAIAGVTDEQLLNQVQSDVQAVLKGGQWILSCYAPFKEKPILPGISDLSPEEARLFIYEAKASNNVDQAVAYMNNLLQETRSKYEQLLQPSASIIKVLRSLYKGEPVSSPFSNTTQSSGFGTSNTAATSIFRSAVQNTPVFGQNANTASIFGQTSPDPAKSIFAQATQNVFGQPNAFAQSPESAPKSLFAQANQNIFAQSPPQTNPANIFANASQQFFNKPADPFGQSQTSSSDPFGQNQTSSPFQTNAAPTGNVFQISDRPQTNVFGNQTNVFQQQDADDSNVYSKMEELSQEDIEAFKSVDFRLGFVPELPPPHALCV